MVAFARLFLPPVLLLACAAPVHAGRPLQTDDAGVIEAGACEFEAAAARESAEGAHAHQRSAQLGCGTSFKTEFAVAVLRAKEPADTVRGLELGGKTALSQAVALSFVLAWARPELEGWRRAAQRVNLIYTAALPADLSLHANLGHAHYRPDRRSATTWGLALEHAGIGPVAPMVELTGDDRGAPSWNTGLRWTAVADTLFLDVSCGQRIAPARPRVVALGLTYAF